MVFMLIVTFFFVFLMVVFIFMMIILFVRMENPLYGTCWTAGYSLAVNCQNQIKTLRETIIHYIG